MYDKDIIVQRERQIVASPLGSAFPDGIPRYSFADCRTLTASTMQAFDENGMQIRRFSADEDRFVAASKLRVLFDAPYYLNFVFIDEEGHGVRSLYPLWGSQSFVLQKLGEMQAAARRKRSPDGLLLNVLKVRQVGISTLGAALVSHRIFTQPNIRAIEGSDTEEQAQYLMRMIERIHHHLPPWLRPTILSHRTGREMVLSNGSSVKTAWGKSTRGALQEAGGKKGNIERGRSQPLEEPVLTPYGWKPMGSIAVGDRVIGSTGEPTKVLGTYLQGIESVYRVTFSDGSWTECSGDHLWQVTTAYKAWAGLRPFVRTTLELLEGGLYWEKPSGRMAKWFVPVIAPVQFERRDHTIPPYTLGVYLGDGSTRTGALQLAARDPEIRARVADELPPDMKISDRDYDHCWYIRRRSAKAPHAYLVALQVLGLREKYSHEKFIPASYLYSSVEDRIALLQGLMDTDGTASRKEGKINFSTTSERLAQDFRSLVEGLGGIARVSMRPPQKPHVRKNGQRIEGRHTSYVFSVCLPPGIVPFHLPRKIAQLTPLEERKYFPKRAITAVEYVGQKATQCLKVAAVDQLYVTRHYAVTHNTNSVVQISELATWDNPEQLDQALLPGVPISEKTLVLFESTAELAGDWWHKHFLAAEDGRSRFQNAFISWPIKYSLPAPEDWTPSTDTLAVSTQIEQESPQWGYPLTLTPDHLYWYETTRDYFIAKQQLHAFLKEYPSNPRECFQYAGNAVFSWEDLERIDQQARKIRDVWAVQPSREIADLRRIKESTGDPEKDLQALGLKQDRRPPAPLATTIPIRQAEQMAVPPGYGFRRLSPQELRDLPNMSHSVMAIYEYPRTRGQFRYVVGVDVGGGLGFDYSAITVTRMPTIEEPMEDVAQYVSNKVRPAELAAICDAIGRYYADHDGIEAVMAIELNNHGVAVQDLLQLHLGYFNFFVWEYIDAADPSSRFSKRIGWTTTARTRPILLEKFHDLVTAMDPITGFAEYRVNSSVTRAEMRHFITETGDLGDAEHAKEQHDDGIFATAISAFVAHKLSGGEVEPIAERRRRRAQLVALANQTGRRRDYRNSAVTLEEADHADDPEFAEFDDQGDDIAYTDR